MPDVRENRGLSEGTHPGVPVSMAIPRRRPHLILQVPVPVREAVLARAPVQGRGRGRDPDLVIAVGGMAG